MFGLTRRSRMRALAGSLGAFVLAGQAWAEPAPPFAQLLREANEAPRVAALEAEVERTQGLADQARARPNPTVSGYVENFAGQRPYAGFGRQETTIQVNQPIELGGKRSARIAAGDAAVVAARARGLEGRVAFAFELARAYIAVEIADRRIELANDVVGAAAEDLRVARALVGAGKEARLRQLQAETELNALQAMVTDAQALRIAALARLSALAGTPTPYTAVSESLLGRLSARPASGPIDPMANASYRAAVAEREAAALRVRVERSRAVPDVTAQFGFRRLEVDGANALVAGVSLPLPLFDRNRGNIAAARAEEQVASARVEATRLDAQASAQAAVAQIDAALARSAAARRTLETAQEAYRLARIAYEAGKSPLIEVLAARQSLGLARGAVVDAESASFDAFAQLARLQNLSITGEPVQ